MALALTAILDRVQDSRVRPKILLTWTSYKGQCRNIH